MRKALRHFATLATLSLVLCTPAHAGPGSVFKGIGKTIGKTFSNFVTWRDPARNLVYLGLAAGIAADMHSTALNSARCPACIEHNPLLPKRPSRRALALYGAGEFLLATTITTAIRESKGPTAFKVMPLVVLGGLTVAHGRAAHSNYRFCQNNPPVPDAGRDGPIIRYHCLSQLQGGPVKPGEPQR